MKAKHVLFVGRSVFHFSYYESIIRALVEHGHTVTIIFDKQWSAKQPDDALKRTLHDCEGLEQSWLIRRTGWLRSFVFCMRELRSVMGYLSRPAQSVFYLNRWLSYLPPVLNRLLKKEIVRKILRTSQACTFIATIERLVPPDRTIMQHVQELRPDVLIASPVNMRFSEELEYIKAAKKQKIPTAIPVLSWDNLTTKGLYHVLPDLVMVWNHGHAEEAINVHGATPDSIVCIGSPFFDKWFGAEFLSMSRIAFCERVGLNPAVPFIAYLGSSRNIAQDETWLVKDIAKTLRSQENNLLSEMQILVRPHPANAHIYDQLDIPGVIVWPRGGQLPESEASQLEFYNTVKHSVSAVGINTSGMVDAVIIGKPVISVITKQYRATQIQAEHFQQLLNADVLQISDDPASCVVEIERALNNEGDKKVQRTKFIEDFVRPYGIEFSAGEVAVVALENMVAGRAAKDISQRLKNRHQKRGCKK